MLSMAWEVTSLSVDDELALIDSIAIEFYSASHNSTDRDLIPEDSFQFDPKENEKA